MNREVDLSVDRGVSTLGHLGQRFEVLRVDLGRELYELPIEVTGGLSRGLSRDWLLR